MRRFGGGQNEDDGDAERAQCCEAVKALAAEKIQGRGLGRRGLQRNSEEMAEPITRLDVRLPMDSLAPQVHILVMGFAIPSEFRCSPLCPRPRP